MAIFKIAKMGHPILRKVAEPITPKDIHSNYIQTLVDNMIDTLVEYEGIGLAAPQIHVSKQLIILDITTFGVKQNEETIIHGFDQP